MLAMLRRQSTSVIAIDRGRLSLRAVQLERTQERWRVHHWINLESEPSTASPPERDLSLDLRLAFGPGTFTGNQVAMLLSPPEIEYRLLDVPATVLNVPQDQLRGALQFELDRHLPWPTMECELAVWPGQPGAGGRVNAMVAAARNAHVQKHLDTLTAAELECQRADVVPSAMVQLCGDEIGESAADRLKTVWGILDIGFNTSRLYLIYEGAPVYARVVRGSGRELTETLAGALHVEFAIAEQYKRIYGLTPSERGFRSVVGGLARISEEALPGVLYSILRPVLEAMADELEKSFRFVLGRMSRSVAGRLYLVGGGARLKGLSELLSNRLGVSVGAPDPARVLPLESHTAQPHPMCSAALFPVLAPCVGLAMMGDH